MDAPENSGENSEAHRMSQAAPVLELREEGDACPTCRAQIVECDCGQGDPAVHLICLGCGEDPPDCDCEPPA